LGWTKIAKGFRTQLDHHVGILGAPSDIWHTALLNDQFDGCVCGLLNSTMEQHIDLVRKWKTKNYQGALDILKSGFLDFTRYVYDDYARLHIRYKIASWLVGLMPEPFMRPPQPIPMKDEILTFKKLMTKMGTNLISDSEINAVMNRLPK
jgi:dihydrodipicolinate synthase/N-acetylneuraminate lyase